MNELAKMHVTLLEQIDEALADPAERALRDALERGLEAVQDLDDDDQPRRLTQAERLEAFAAIYTAVASVADISRELMVGYTHLAGLSLAWDEEGPSIDIFDVDELLDVNLEQTHHREKLGRVAFFASDGGDGFYAVDARGNVGGQPGSVLWVDRESSRWRVVARDFAELMRSGDPG